MKTYIVHLLCREDGIDLGSFTLQAADWEAADRIVKAMFPDDIDGDLWTSIEEGDG